MTNNHSEERERTSVTFTCSSQFNEALRTYATKHHTTTSDLIRAVVAEKIDYDISREPKRKPREVTVSQEQKELRNKLLNSLREKMRERDKQILGLSLK